MFEKRGVQKMSWAEVLNSILKIIQGEGDIKSIVAVIIVIAIIGIIPAIAPLILKVVEARERRQQEKMSDKVLLDWMKKGTKEKTYTDMLLEQYVVWAIIFLVCLFIHLFLYYFKSNILAHIISKFVHILCSGLYGIFLLKNEKVREEIKSEKKYKVTLSIAIYVIFFITLCLASEDATFKLSVILFWVMILAWLGFVFWKCEFRYAYENKYVNVNTAEFGKIKNVQAWNIKNRQGRVGLTVCKKGKIKERYAKKEGISGVIYHGKPITVTSKVKFFTTYNTLVEDQK